MAQKIHYGLACLYHLLFYYHLVPATEAVKNLNHKGEVTGSYLHTFTFAGALWGLKCISFHRPLLSSTISPLLTVFTWPTPIISHHWFQVSPSLPEAFTDCTEKYDNSPSQKIKIKKNQRIVSALSSYMPWGPLIFPPGELPEDEEGLWRSFAYPNQIVNNGGRASSAQQARTQLFSQGPLPMQGLPGHKQSGWGLLLWRNSHGKDIAWAGSPWSMLRDKNTLPQERTQQMGYTRQRKGGQADTPTVIPTWRREIF